MLHLLQPIMSAVIVCSYCDFGIQSRCSRYISVSPVSVSVLARTPTVLLGCRAVAHWLAGFRFGLRSTGAVFSGGGQLFRWSTGQMCFFSWRKLRSRPFFMACDGLPSWNVSSLVAVGVGRGSRRANNALAFSWYSDVQRQHITAVWGFMMFLPPPTDWERILIFVLFRISNTIALLQKKKRREKIKHSTFCFCSWLVQSREIKWSPLASRKRVLLVLLFVIINSYGRVLTWSRMSWVTVCPCSTSRAPPPLSISTTAKTAVRLD